MNITVCLIVRNEEHTISRALDSIRGFADRWCIVDTGSTDRTKEVIAEATRGWPGELHERPWVDFSTNRNELLDLAGEDGWLLLMDADHTLEWAETDKEEIQKTQYGGFRIRSAEEPSYWNIRLVDAALPWHYQGTTHEYLECQRPVPVGRSAMTIVHHGDGGFKTHKYQRDLELLTKSLQENPKDARSWFYLGHTYRGLGQHDKALEAYQRRIELTPRTEETYLAAIISALLHQQEGRHDKALELYLRAWRQRPSRHEAIFAALQKLNQREDFEQAYQLGREALRQPANTTDILHVHSQVTTALLPLEWSRSALSVGDTEGAMEVLCTLLERTDISEDVRLLAHSNLYYAVQMGGYAPNETL